MIYTFACPGFVNRPESEDLVCPHVLKCEMLEKRVAELETFLRRAAEVPARMQAKMGQHGLKIDNLDDPMQKLALTLYTELAVLSHEAERLLPEEDKP